jgi:hypothetical protein
MTIPESKKFIRLARHHCRHVFPGVRLLLEEIYTARRRWYVTFSFDVPRPRNKNLPTFQHVPLRLTKVVTMDGAGRLLSIRNWKEQ